MRGNVAGPLLLNALLKYLGRSRSPMRDDQLPSVSGEAERTAPATRGALNLDSLAYGCCLVALLGLTAAAKVLGPHTPLMACTVMRGLHCMACTAMRSGPSVCLPFMAKRWRHRRFNGLR